MNYSAIVYRDAKPRYTYFAPTAASASEIALSLIRNGDADGVVVFDDDGKPLRAHGLIPGKTGITAY